MFDSIIQSKNEIIALNLPFGLELSLKREDLIHPTIPGNKFRKLKYNFQAAQAKGCDAILTFGGAFSNHIAAVAALGASTEIRTIGYIRGDELIHKINENPSLLKAKELGMELKFLSREAYRRKNDPLFLQELKRQHPQGYLIPEGGTNELAIKGCREIISEKDEIYDYICVAVGTGGTMSGIVQAVKPNQHVLGFPAVKGDFLKAEISKRVNTKTNWELIKGYDFGGYAKINHDLISFINTFKAETTIPLDPIYTGKMMYGILDLIDKGYFKRNTKIMAIHTGGLQGIAGMNAKLKQKGWPLIR